eukprot:CAMPEP_0183378420 /NCGR_PEP_ID=MMETSP0164_2-20130417/124905_1 /TAXON_ID=221442 /ORGANISM="Coccolithus pelagicus ssp braarudi, Strain PLY182g" /LENGTH=265 /DNA_ID=CAMNT_0025555979 /DNA_START=569 /DNA_END=1366 /DNA_ORIENTATION=-
MAVDALSYVGNLVAECRTDLDASSRALLELSMSAASLLLLAAFTGYFMVEGAKNAGLLGQAPGEDEEEVDAFIVLGFAALGIVFDVLSLIAYQLWHLGPGKTTELLPSDTPTSLQPLDARAVYHEGPPAALTPEPDAAPAAAARRVPPEDADRRGDATLLPPNEPLACSRGGSGSGGGGRSSINMLSALLHVLSDLARSTTTLVEGVFLLLRPELGGAMIDGWSALAVCALISFGVLTGIGKWLHELCRYLEAHKHARSLTMPLV